MPESIVSLEKAKEVLENGMKTADEWLGSNEKMEQLFKDVTARLKTTPLIGDTINDFPTMVSMVKDYVSKDYTKVSLRVQHCYQEASKETFFIFYSKIPSFELRSHYPTIFVYSL